jgi:hypothetical protein
VGLDVGIPKKLHQTWRVFLEDLGRRSFRIPNFFLVNLCLIIYSYYDGKIMGKNGNNMGILYNGNMMGYIMEIYL